MQSHPPEVVKLTSLGPPPCEVKTLQTAPNEEEKKLDITLAEGDLILRQVSTASRINLINYVASRFLHKDIFIHAREFNKVCVAHYEPEGLSEEKSKKSLSGWDDIHFLPFIIRNYLYILFHLTKKDFVYLSDKNIFTQELKDQDKSCQEMIKTIRDLILMANDCYQVCLQLNDILNKAPEYRSVAISELVVRIVSKVKNMKADKKIILPVASTTHQMYLLIEKQILDNGDEGLILTIADTASNKKKYPKDHANFPGENFFKQKGSLVMPRVVGTVSIKSVEEINNFVVYLNEIFNLYDKKNRSLTYALYDVKARIKKPNPMCIRSVYYTSQAYDNCVSFNWFLAVNHLLENPYYFNWLHMQEKTCMNFSIHESTNHPPIEIEECIPLDSLSFRIKIMIAIIKETAISYLDVITSTKTFNNLIVEPKNAELVARCNRIISVDLSRKNITDSTLDDVIFVLKLFPNVRLLNFSNNKISTAGAKKILDYLNAPACKVKAIHLTNNLMDERCKKIMKMAIYAKSLHKLADTSSLRTFGNFTGVKRKESPVAALDVAKPLADARRVFQKIEGTPGVVPLELKAPEPNRSTDEVKSTAIGRP